jgi:hypothetical protein
MARRQAWALHFSLASVRGTHFRRVRLSEKSALKRRQSGGRQCVAAPGFNTNVVNRSAPELFLVTIMLKEPFIQAQRKIVALSM